MGSFYSTCSVSNMTLTNQRTSILLLAPGYSTDLSGHLNMIVSNDGSQSFFSPFGFPIHGEYDDYGYIVNIQRDKNVQMLEEFFGVSIDDILRNIGDNRSLPKDLKNEELFQKLGMTYFRTEVLEYLERDWDKINIIDPEEYSSGSRLLKLFKSLEKNKVSMEDPRFLELISKVDKTDDEREELFDLMDMMSGASLREGSYISSISKCNMFKLLPITIDFKNDILKQYQFLITLGYELSRILKPSVYGSQDTNWKAQYELNEFVNDLLIEDLKSYYCDEDEYEEINEMITSHKINKRDKKLNNLLD